METIEETLTAPADLPTESVKAAPHSQTHAPAPTWWDNHALGFEKARFGWMAILITVQSCMGAIACLYILKNDASIFALAACAGASMGSNALFIGLASPKACLVGFYLSMFINTSLLILNLQL
jgi:hypothetical protein